MSGIVNEKQFKLSGWDDKKKFIEIIRIKKFLGKFLYKIHNSKIYQTLLLLRFAWYDASPFWESVYLCFTKCLLKTGCSSPLLAFLTFWGKDGLES